MRKHQEILKIEGALTFYAANFCLVNRSPQFITSDSWHHWSKFGSEILTLQVQKEKNVGMALIPASFLHSNHCHSQRTSTRHSAPHRAILAM